MGILHPVPDRVKPSFVIFDIRALWRSALSVRVPGCQKCKRRLNLVWHKMLYRCTHVAPVDIKGFIINAQPQTSCWNWIRSVWRSPTACQWAGDHVVLARQRTASEAAVTLLLTHIDWWRRPLTSLWRNCHVTSRHRRDSTCCTGKQ